jgi:hypothetical protein
MTPLLVAMTRKRSSAKSFTQSMEAIFSPSAQPQEGGDGLALRGAGALGHVVHLLRMALADVREEQDVVVRAGGEEPLHEVVLVRLGADDALAAAFLRAVVGDGGALDEAEVGDGDDAALVRDDVLHAELAERADDLGAARRGVLRLHLEQLRS